MAVGLLHGIQVLDFVNWNKLKKAVGNIVKVWIILPQLISPSPYIHIQLPRVWVPDERFTIRSWPYDVKDVFILECITGFKDVNSDMFNGFVPGKVT